ncbi:MAG: hypothetical protein C1O27_001666 [Chloroflexi bacterium]|jgi:hypothetical protein|nr:MAG: hypothetical protein C1O27_001666 [Chloroflexota bacterium]
MVAVGLVLVAIGMVGVPSMIIWLISRGRRERALRAPVFMLVALAALFLAGIGLVAASNEEVLIFRWQSSSSTPTPAPTSTATMSEQIHRLLADELGVRSAEGLLRVRDVRLSDTTYAVDLSGDVGFFISTQSVLHRDTLKVMQAILDGVSSSPVQVEIGWWIELPDSNGQEIEGQVMTVCMTYDTLSRIAWDIVNIDDVPSLADCGYTIHDEIS